MKKTNNLKSVKKNKKNHKNRIMKHKIRGGAPDGHELIGSGTFGCVYSPPLLCTFHEKHKHKPSDISKLMSPLRASSEHRRNMYLCLLGYDTEYKLHMPPPSLCTLDRTKYPKEQDKANFGDCDLFKFKPESADGEALFERGENLFVEGENLLIFENGGLSFLEILGIKEYLNPKYVLGEKGLQNILEAIVKLQEKGLVHCDIKVDNLVTGNINLDILKSKNRNETKLDEAILELTNYRLIDFANLSLSKKLPSDITFNKECIGPIREPQKLKDSIEFGIVLSDENYINDAFANYNNINTPIYSFFIGKGKNYLQNTPQEDVLSSIREKISNYFQEINSRVLGILEEYYNNSPSYDFPSIENAFIIKMENIYDRLKYQLDARNYTGYAGYVSDILIMINKIDLWGFGIILLFYLNMFRVHFRNHHLFLENLIYDFLDKTHILDPNPFSTAGPPDIEAINRQFNSICEVIINSKLNPESWPTSTKHQTLTTTLKSGGFKNTKLKRKSKLNRKHNLRGDFTTSKMKQNK